MDPRSRFLTLALAALVLPLPALAATAQTSAADGPLPDFRPVSLTWGTPRQEGAYVLLNATLHNAGGHANGTQQVAFLVNGTLHALATVANPKPGTNVTLSVPWRVRPGDHLFEVRADHNATYNETDETNNALAVAAHVPWPDLAATGLATHWETHPEDPLYADERFSIAATLANLGHLASAHATLTITIDGALTFAYAVGPLAPGQATVRSTGSLQGLLAPGPHTATMRIDANGTVAESDETNNEATLAFEVLPLPTTDARIRILGVERPTLRTDLGPLMPNPLGRRTILVEIANVGEGPLLRGDLEVALRDSRAATDDETGRDSRHVLAWSPMPRLGPGESVVLRVPWTPVGFGDATITAHARTGAQPDADAANDRDHHEDFILLGGLGVGLVPLAPRTLV